MDGAVRQWKYLTRFEVNMGYRVEVTARAARDLKILFQYINARYSPQASAWFNELEDVVFSLKEYPNRGKSVPEHRQLRQLIYGNKPHICPIIYKVDGRAKKVVVLHIRYASRDVITTDDIGTKY
jgi:plasmid stabilization system protein ParE